MPEETTTGALDTNVRLLTQRVTLLEADLRRLGDSLRQNTRDIGRLDSITTQNEKLIDYRLEDLADKLKDITENGKDVRRWLAGISSALVVTFLMALFDLLRR